MDTDYNQFTRSSYTLPPYLRAEMAQACALFDLRQQEIISQALREFFRKHGIQGVFADVRDAPVDAIGTATKTRNSDAPDGILTPSTPLV